MIKKGSKAIISRMIGSKVVQFIYKGALLVYQSIKNYLVSGVFPLTLEKTKGEDLVNYKIEGNSIQNGTPTPEAPIEVGSVGDKTSNLADLSKATPSSSTQHVTLDYDNATGTLELTSIPRTYDYATISAEKLGLEVGKTYYFGGDVVVEGKTTNNITNTIFELGTSAGYDISFKNNGTRHIAGKFTYTGQGNVNLRMFFNYGSAEPAKVTFKNIYVSEVKDEFEPYGYKIPVKANGKNLFNKNGLSLYGYTGDTFTVDDVQCAKIYQTDGEYGICISNIFKENTQYSLKFREKYVESRGYVRIDFIYTDETIGKALGEDSTSNWSTRIATSDKGKTVSKIRISNAGNGISYAYYLDLDSFQLEEGLTIEDYESYQEPITTNIYLDEPLRKIGKYADYIDFTNKKVVRYVNYTQYNGSESWELVGIEGGNFSYYAVKIGEYNSIVANLGLNTQLERTNITSNNTTVGFNNINSSGYGQARLCVRPNISTYSNLSLWLEFLKTSSMTNYYVLAIPTEETIELPSILTLKGTTILDSDVTIQPSNVEVEYTTEKSKTSIQLILSNGDTLLDSNGDYFNVKGA